MPRKTSTRDRLLQHALGFPGAHEDHPWGDTVVKVGAKIFVFLGDADETADGRISVKLDDSLEHALSVTGAVPTGYGLGRAGWVTVPLAAPEVDVDVLTDWIEESYRRIAPKRLVRELDGPDGAGAAGASGA